MAGAHLHGAADCPALLGAGMLGQAKRLPPTPVVCASMPSIPFQATKLKPALLLLAALGAFLSVALPAPLAIEAAIVVMAVAGGILWQCARARAAARRASAQRLEQLAVTFSEVRALLDSSSRRPTR